METGSEATVMAKAKTAKRKEPAPLKSLKTIGIKCAPEWADWLERYARHQRTTVASVVDRALAKDSAEQGFEAPPERIP